jgi:putative transcriptional regulator
VSHRGRLLVATPLIAEPTFERTVVLLLAHGPDGAFGVVLNRPSAAAVTEVAPEWSEAVAAPSVVFVGGPVGRESLLGLGRGGGPTDGSEVIVEDCAPVDLHRPPGEGGPQWASVRLFAGSAGWAAGQLEDELAEGAWWPVEAHGIDVFTTDPVHLWAAVLRRQGGEVAWFANHPTDPSAN